MAGMKEVWCYSAIRGRCKFRSLQWTNFTPAISIILVDAITDWTRVYEIVADRLRRVAALYLIRSAMMCGLDALDEKSSAPTSNSKERKCPVFILQRSSTGAINDGVVTNVVAACVPAVFSPPTINTFPVAVRFGRKTINPYVCGFPSVP